MGELSSETWVTSGVPQGSVLGPLLFTILISDIDSGVLLSKFLTYADDTKAYKGISDPSHQTDLQSDLDNIYSWADRNNQEFNEKKIETIRFTLKLSNYLTPQNLAIKQCSIVKDLGIFLSSNCSFTDHINTIIAKAKKLCGWIMRTFQTRERYTMVTLLKSLILPTIEYCCPLWSPTLQSDINRLEKIQQSFTKKMDGFHNFSYKD